MITISTEVGKFYFTDFVSLGSNETATIDETTLFLSQLKSLRDGYTTNRLLVSTEDKQKIEAAIISKSQSGGSGQVASVNGEIGEVELDASEIDLTSGGSIEAKLGELAPVAFSGSYLDLSNRPGGTGEPFTVLPWNPYREDLVTIPFTPQNNSTGYTEGHIFRQSTESIQTYQVEVGYPNNPEIIITNGIGGTKTNINITPVGSGNLTKTVAIKTLKSLSVKPVDVFAHDGNPKGAVLSMFIVQVEDNEDISTLPLQDLLAKPRNISVNFSNVYQNEYNTYTSLGYSITVGGSAVENNSVNIHGDYSSLFCKINNNILTLGNGFVERPLGEYGFDPLKKFACVMIVQVNTSSFDNVTPFNITIEELSEQPVVINSGPDNFHLRIHKDSLLNLGFETSVEIGEFFYLNLVESLGDISYNIPGNQLAIGSDYIDAEGKVEVKLEGDTFSLKNFTFNVFTSVYVKTAPLSNVYIATNGDGTDWYFDLLLWNKSLILDGIPPLNSVDGSVLYITNAGKFDGRDLIFGDYIQLYGNKTKFILNRIVDPAAEIDTRVSTLAGDGLQYVDSKLGLKLAANSGLEYIGNSELRVQTVFDNRYYSYPVMFNRLYEQATVSYGSSQLSLDLTNNANIYVYKLNSSGQNVFSYINLDTNAFGTAQAMGKTVTMLFTDITAQTYITWPSQFLWANEEVPELVVGKKILVTGIVLGTQWESFTENKLLCTYSIF